METQTPRPAQVRRGHFFTKQRIPDAVEHRVPGIFLKSRLTQ